ncbi:MAG TPA: hypothetical protein VEX13_15760 [Chloroflexia bacterium]|nr:hypothetical protein [Chloroflexia bacterium]
MLQPDQITGKLRTGIVASMRSNLADEIHMIKIGLLYSDEVLLTSIRSTMIERLVLNVLVSERYKETGIQVPFILNDDGTLSLEQPTDRISGAVVAAYEIAQQGLPEDYDPIDILNEFISAILSGHVETLEPLSYNIQFTQPREKLTKKRSRPTVIIGPDKSVVADKYPYKVVVDSLLTDSSTLPLVDRFVFESILSFGEGRRKGVPSQSNASVAAQSRIKSLQGRVGQIALAADLFSRLPTFDASSVNEILDIRKELANPLINFRSIIGKLSSQIESAPWDQNFPYDADQLVRREIEPLVLALEEQVNSNTFWEHLSRKAVHAPLEVAKGSIIGLALSALSTLPPAILTALGVGIGGGFLTLDAYNEWLTKKRESERNQLYFYCEARKRLNNRRKKNKTL